MTTHIPLQTMSIGETKSIIITVQTPLLDDDDITSYTFTWRLWHVLTGVVVEKTVDDGITILDQTENDGENKGKLLVAITKSDTDSIPPLTYSQELRMFFGGAELKVGEGHLQLSPSRTIPATVTP